MPRQDYAVCIFGSAARDNKDELSDKDLLVVIDDYRRIPRNTIKKWHKEGWTVTWMTWDKVSRGALLGDTLILNFKLEGQIIQDVDNRFQDILNSFQPLENYDQAIARSLIQLKPLERIPNTPWLAQMQCGLAFRFTRGLLMKRLANHKIYTFDLSEVYKNYQEIDPTFLSSDVRTLQTLRVIMRAYRQRQLYDGQVLEMLAGAKALISHLLNYKFEEIDPKSEARLFRSPSTSAKDIEARILAYFDPIELDKGELLRDVWKMVHAPTVHGWDRDGVVYKPHLDAINQAIAETARGQSK